MPEIRVVVKPTAGGDKIEQTVDTDSTIQQLKEELAEKASIPASNQRLIYKGQILKDERTVESYGVYVVWLCPGTKHPPRSHTHTHASLTWDVHYPMSMQQA